MWTLIVLASAALLWLFKLTLAPDAAEPLLFGAEFLRYAPQGLSVLAGVLLLQRLLGHVLNGPSSPGGEGRNAPSDLLQAVISMALYLVAALLYLGWGLGVDIRSVLVTSAMLTAIVGLALQPTLGHLFAGASIEIESRLRVGDFVKRDEMEGQVMSLSWRSVSLRTERGSRIVIPNGEFNSRPIELISADQPFRHQVLFNLASDLPPAHVLRTAMQVLCSGLPGICAEPMPSVVLLGTDPQTGTLRYAARLYTLEFLARAAIASGFLERLWYALSREGLSHEAWWPTPRLSLLRTGAAQYLDGGAAEFLSTGSLSRRHTVAADAAAPGRVPENPLAKGALTELDPRLQNVLLSCAKTLRYGPFERCDSHSVALVYQGRLVENRDMNAQQAQAAVLALVAQIEHRSPAFAVQPLNHSVYQVLLREATLVLGPLAHDLCKRIALLTPDPHMAYQAVATFISEPRQRAAFLGHAGAQPNRCLAEGDWLGWAHVLDLEPEVPVCRSSEACTLLVWPAPVLRGALKTASSAELQSLADVLRVHAPGCESLNTLQLQSWVQGTSAQVAGQTG